MKVDLIAGFLGAGKTTFIKKYLKYLEQDGSRIHIIENEFGNISIDTEMLTEICENPKEQISDLTGVCMCCVGKERFINLLLWAAGEGYDRVLVEPSGIYDVDEFFSILSLDMVKPFCDPGNIITIVDGTMLNNMTPENRYMMACQVLAAGKIVLSKTQLQPSEQVDRTLCGLNQMLEELGCSRRFAAEDIYTKNWDDLTAEEFTALSTAGFHLDDHDRKFLNHAAVYSQIMIAGRCENAADLEQKLEKLYRNQDNKFGNIYRIKGYIQDIDKQWYQVNSTPSVTEITPIARKRGVLLFIGQELEEEAINGCFLPREKKKRLISLN